MELTVVSDKLESGNLLNFRQLWGHITVVIKSCLKSIVGMDGSLWWHQTCNSNGSKLCSSGHHVKDARDVAKISANENFLYLLFSYHKVGIVRTTWLVLCCKFGNSLLVMVSIPPIANTLYWPLDGSSPLPRNSTLFKLLQIPSACLATPRLHSDQSAFLVHPSVIPILKSTKCYENHCQVLKVVHSLLFFSKWRWMLWW